MGVSCLMRLGVGTPQVRCSTLAAHVPSGPSTLLANMVRFMTAPRPSVLPLGE